MLIIGFSLILAICLFSLFSLNFKVNGLNRLIISLPKQIFEYSVPLTELDDELYFMQEKVKLKYQEYVEASVYKYVSSYEVDYFFYNTSDFGACNVNDCQGVEITFKAPINDFYTYKYISFYEIRRML